MTKRALQDLLRRELDAAGFNPRGYRVEAIVYPDRETFEADEGNYTGALCDFTPWTEALRMAEPGRVFDLFVYAKPAFGWEEHDLIDNVVVYLPGRPA